MKYSDLQIFRSAMELAKYVDIIVRSFNRDSRYTFGQDLRVRSQELLFLISKINRTRNKIEFLRQLVERCDEFLIIVYLAQELKLIKSFSQFERLSKLGVDVTKQANGWYNSFARTK
jgi:hypothetical protein